MTELVFFLEEPSARAMLEGILPKLLPDDVVCRYVVFEGKQDLEKRLPRRLRGWRAPHAKFVVMRDQDSGDCHAIKAGLLDKCRQAGKPEVLVRIACRELESFCLGDLAAVGRAFADKHLEARQAKAKFREPDNLASPAEELKKLVPAYQKVSGSRVISAEMDTDSNQSHSFRVLVSGIRALAGEQI